VLIYVDDDQLGLYGFMSTDRVKVFHGPRRGPVYSANKLVEWNRQYAAYGLITDDSVVVTPKWDEWTLAAMNQFDGIAVVDPHHNHGTHVDMPFVSRKWVDLVGWFACPMVYHYAWPIATGLIGEMTAIVHAPEESFHIEHDYDPDANTDLRDNDYKSFFAYVSAFLMPDVSRIRNKMIYGSSEEME
jgi:hypothetical protein